MWTSNRYFKLNKSNGLFLKKMNYSLSVLDPSRPGFDCSDNDVSWWKLAKLCEPSGVSKTCASQVDQFSTSPGDLGTKHNQAKVNIHVNKANKYRQPNCEHSDRICCHSFAWKLFAALVYGKTFKLDSNSEELTLHHQLSDGTYQLSLDNDSCYPYTALVN